MTSGYLYYLENIAAVFGSRHFRGWGRKRTGRFALWCHRRFGGKMTLLEDGFIRSINLGAEGSPAFSLVEDDTGIYYDATQPSALENMLNTYDFNADEALMAKAREAIGLIKKHRISKYNHAPDPETSFFKHGEKRILVIAQTSGDASLRYGFGERFSTGEMIDAALRENPDATVYIKIHPDVLSGEKESDIDPAAVSKRCEIIAEDLNPIALLEQFDKVYTKTSQMGFEALLLGKDCVCFGMPFYAGWGVTDDRVGCERRKRRLKVEEIFAAAYILYTRYHNPYTKRPSDIIDTIETIVRYRGVERTVDDKAYFFGFSYWKHMFVKPFFKEITSEKLHFVNPLYGEEHLQKALELGLDAKSRIYIWGRRAFDEVETYASEHGIPLYRVEDGFIRSVGLGSDLTQPYSLVIDSRGIYFDPTVESDLEHLLNFHRFTKGELERAKRLRHHMIDRKLSKYNNYRDVKLALPENRKIVLVPGQVEDDASVKYGSRGMRNLELLQRARETAPDAYIIYKPHPDVLAGNRVGHVEPDLALKYCDRIISEVSLDSVLGICDEVHTMTSLVGFEAIMRGITVYTYGLPFYAGWGLSRDAISCDRRRRELSVDELTAAVLLLYPRYIDPLTNERCEAEVTMAGLQEQKRKLDASPLYRTVITWRNRVSRRSQLILRFFK